MANVNYAPAGSGPFAGAIGWINFPPSLAVGAFTVINDTLRDGSTISFTLTNTRIAGTTISFIGTTAPVSFSTVFGSLPVPAAGYFGILGPVAFYTQSEAMYRNLISFNNIVVKDSIGNTIPDYTIVLCDAESTGTGETIIYTTNGSPWGSLGLIGPGVSPAYTGFGTTTLTLTGNAIGSYRAIVSATNSPKNVAADINELSVLGRQAIAFGVVLSKVNVSKVVNNRAYQNDQFNISVIATTISSTTITTGNSNGAQPQNSFLYPILTTLPNNPVTITESMAAGSSGILGFNYTTTVLNSNITPGGTIVPSTGSLGQTISINFGDYILSTIINTAITSILTSTKTVDQSKALPGDTLTYTVSLNNLGPLTVGNITFIDTIPTGSSFVANSITLNGVTIPGSVAPPSGVNIGTIPAGAISTVTFKVLLQNNLLIGTSIQNRAFVSGFNFLVPESVTISANSNTITSTILGTVPISTTKAVDKDFADVGNILNYTFTIVNNGNTTAFNIVFIDTIPNGTSLVPNSLMQDGINVAGSPNPPGVALPNSIGPGQTSTVTFSVTVITIPSPNPVINIASESFSYIFDTTTTPNTIANGSANTNTVSTTVNNSNLGNISKFTDKNYISCNGIITYTISIPNIGNTTAINILFIDTVPSGTTLVPNSVMVNGLSQPGADPSLGITIPDIGGGSVSTLSFRVQVNC